MVGRSGIHACYSYLYFDFDLFMDCVMNDNSELLDQVLHIAGGGGCGGGGRRPSRGLGWNRGCRSGIEGDRKRR